MNEKLQVKEWTMERHLPCSVKSSVCSGHWDIAYHFVRGVDGQHEKRSIRLKYAEHLHQFTDLLGQAGYSYVDLEDLKRAGARGIFSV